jgi:hypothetical protein
MEVPMLRSVRNTSLALGVGLGMMATASVGVAQPNAPERAPLAADVVVVPTPAPRVAVAMPVQPRPQQVAAVIPAQPPVCNSLLCARYIVMGIGF